jgi:hypothetical protein
VGSRAAADGDQNSVDRERLLLPFHSSPALIATITCKTKQNATQQADFILFYF